MASARLLPEFLGSLSLARQTLASIGLLNQHYVFNSSRQAALLRKHHV